MIMDSSRWTKKELYYLLDEFWRFYDVFILYSDN